MAYAEVLPKNRDRAGEGTAQSQAQAARGREGRREGDAQHQGAAGACRDARAGQGGGPEEGRRREEGGRGAKTRPAVRKAQGKAPRTLKPERGVRNLQLSTSSSSGAIQPRLPRSRKTLF